jgi:YcxB-like protein
MSESAPATFELSFQLTVRDIYKANVAINLQPFRRLGIAFLGLMFLFFAFVIFVLASDHNWQTLRTNWVTWFGLFVPLFLAYAYFGAPYFRARSLYNNSENWRSTIRYFFSDEIVRVEMATARSELQWTHFIKAQETGDLFFLYIRKKMAHVVLKRAFSSAESLETFRQLLRRHITNVSLHG